MLFHRSSSWSCRAWEDNPSDLGEKGPTPFLTRHMAGSELRACMEGAAHRAGIAEDPITL